MVVLVMADRRPDDSKVPYDFYPPEVLKNRRAPYIDFREMDWIYDYPGDVTLVTALVDLNRDDRSFEDHYLKGLDELLSVRNPLVVYCDPQYHDYITQRRKDLSIATSNNRITLKSFTLDDVKNFEHYDKIQSIISDEKWVNQAEWMKNSVISSPNYIPLTLIKNYLLQEIATINPMNSKRFYWIDSGMYNSFGVTDPIKEFNFLKCPRDNFFVTSYPYWTDTEIHGYNIEKMTNLIGSKPTYVCRATLFGGSKEQIEKFNYKYFQYINESLEVGAIGTEEAIFTIIAMKHPELVMRIAMINGDIKNYLNLIRR